ncbi:MAG TPA: RNA polymerase sigma factor [Solirubrobacteraceae bacterium]|jgi:RNA polymerase sigma-70 factor (ECF subfamily)
MSSERVQRNEFVSPKDTTAAGFRAGSAAKLDDHDPELVGAVRRAQEGDDAAIRYLYLLFKDNVYGYVLSLVRDADDAEDITQHVFLKLIGVIHKYEPREVPFASWLLRVARNVALDHLRQRRLVPCEEVYAPGDAGDDLGRERRWGLEQALAELPEEQRNVVMLRHLVGLSPGEIAERIGRSEAAVHGLHHRARRAIRRELIEADCAPTVHSRRPARSRSGAAPT